MNDPNVEQSGIMYRDQTSMVRQDAGSRHGQRQYAVVDRRQLDEPQSVIQEVSNEQQQYVDPSDYELSAYPTNRRLVSHRQGNYDDRRQVIVEEAPQVQRVQKKYIQVSFNP